MPSDAICVLHTQIPREPRTEPNEPRFRKILLGLVSVYWLLISVRSRSRPRSKKPDRYRFEPPNRYRAPSSLGSFAGLPPIHQRNRQRKVRKNKNKKSKKNTCYYHFRNNHVSHVCKNSYIMNVNILFP